MTTKFKQNGVSFGGFIMLLLLLVVVSIFSMKLIPAYMENGKIQHALDAIVSDPAMQEASVADIKASFEKRANTMDAVNVVTKNDIEINKADGRLTLSVSYSKKIALGGNISLLLEFNPSATR